MTIEHTPTEREHHEGIVKNIVDNSGEMMTQAAPLADDIEGTLRTLAHNQHGLATAVYAFLKDAR